MATRLKVKCDFKSQPGQGTTTSMLSFSPVYNGSEENKRFFAATPGGIFQFYTVNTEAADSFEIGKEYYIDIFASE